MNFVSILDVVDSQFRDSIIQVSQHCKICFNPWCSGFSIQSDARKILANIYDVSILDVVDSQFRGYIPLHIPRKRFFQIKNILQCQRTNLCFSWKATFYSQNSHGCSQYMTRKYRDYRRKPHWEQIFLYVQSTHFLLSGVAFGYISFSIIVRTSETIFFAFLR